MCVQRAALAEVTGNASKRQRRMEQLCSTEAMKALEEGEARWAAQAAGEECVCGCARASCVCVVCACVYECV